MSEDKMKIIKLTLENERLRDALEEIKANYDGIVNDIATTALSPTKESCEGE